MKTQGNGREACIVADLGFGDAGKGSIVDYLARTRRAHAVIRFNGGSQAAHNVVAPDGTHHTFAQFGSATLVPGVRTHLSRHMIVNPPAMLVEADVLRKKGVADAFARTTISAEALVITPYQRAANRLRELARDEGRHGSCGQGIGETAADALALGRSVVRAGDFRDPSALRRKLRWLQAHKRQQLRDTIERCRGIPAAADEIAWLEGAVLPDGYARSLGEFARLARVVDDAWLGEILRRPGTVVFEGAQGVLLDEWRGFHPYTTWSTCTFENALGLLAEHGYDGRVERLGVVRAYATRHGPGPFVTEDAALTAAIPDMHNRMDDWQRGFRVGWFDAVATRYAMASCGGVDALAVTCLDRLGGIGDWRRCEAYVMPDAVRRAGDEEFFVHADGRPDVATDIRLGPARDLAYQEALTAALGRASPWYGSSASAADHAARADEHLGRIASALRAPIRIVSSGPGPGDKRTFG